MLEYRTKGLHGQAVKYSPFFDSRIAVASATNFSLVGNGRLYILGLTPNGIVCEKWFDTQDALYDLAWSEAHENQVLTANGDGSIKLFDIGLDNNSQFPIQSWQEHNREVFSVCWNLVSKDSFCSSSWDETIKVYDPTRPTSLLTLVTHSCTYSALFSPHNPSLLSAVTSDSHLRLYDLRTPESATNHLTLTLPLHNTNPPTPSPAAAAGASPFPPTPSATPPSEALTHDWNKYRDTIIATAGVDRTIRVFDLRMAGRTGGVSGGGPVSVLEGHGYGVKKVAWSPHLEDVLLSCGYDMTCRVWSDGFKTAGGGGGGGGGMVGEGGRGKELGRMERHTEFVTGVDWCLFGGEGWAASVGWDQRVCVWDVREVMAGVM